VDGDDHGIVKGYASGDLSFTANQWGGVANPGEFGVSGTQFTPNAVEVKSYFLGGQRVAIARNEVRFYLHADHLGSASLTTDGSGSVVSEMRYYPYGETRSGGAPTDRRYTGQREENGLGLYDYVARRYDPVLGRFLQADTIVPEPGDPQSLNRYSYVNNNPLRYVDPTGHEMTEWDWLNRWYNAHGYFWDAATKFWSVIGDPIFQDIDIAREVIAEAGIVLGGWYSWGEDSIRKVAFGVAVFGQKLGGGLGALTDLLGGGATIQLADRTDIYCSGGRLSCAPPSSLRGDGSLVLLNKGNFEGKSMLGGAQNVVHELAHVIDWQNNFSREWMDAHGPLTDYAARAPNVPVFARRKWEVWAEAVTKYVFGHFDADGGYVSSFAADQVDRYGGSGALTTQMSDMRAMLEGW
jgi:RHS repeat-associated protein